MDIFLHLTVIGKLGTTGAPGSQVASGPLKNVKPRKLIVSILAKRQVRLNHLMCFCQIILKRKISGHILEGILLLPPKFLHVL